MLNNRTENMKAQNNQYAKLRDLVKNFDGDAIAECFADKPVMKVADAGDVTYFITNKGKLFSVYTSKLK